MNDNEKIPNDWTYEVPKICNKQPVKLFELKKPYYGPRVNSTITEMPNVFPKKMESKGLSDIKKQVPITWSWKERGTNKIEKGGLRDQGKCGGCWAFATASALGDRYALKYNIAAPYPSSAWLITNAKPDNIPSNQECLKGGNTFLAGKWLENNGIKLEKCWPYSIIRDKNYISPEPLNQLPKDCCYNCCSDDFIKQLSETVLFCDPHSTKYLAVTDNEETENVNAEATIAAIQYDIMAYGPVVSSFNVYEDFMEYWIHDAPSGKIYMRNSDKFSGGHAVVLTGWGQENVNGKLIRYWEVRNSWGPTGDGGYCKIAFSTDTPKEKWIQIDVPSFNGGNWNGGVISFLPGPLQDKNYFEKGIQYDINDNNGKETKKPDKKTKNSKKNNIENIILIIIGIVVLIVGAYIYYKITSNKSSGNNSNNTYTIPYKSVRSGSKYTLPY